MGEPHTCDVNVSEPQYSDNSNVSTVV